MSDENATTLITRKFLAGTVGGIAQTLSSAPMDIVKVRLQANQFPTIGSCIKSTLKDEGILAFYKGAMAPTCISGVFNATLFASQAGAKSLITYVFALDPKEPMPLRYVSLSGIMAAPVAVFVLTPADQIKVLLQVSAAGQYKGMLDCAAQIVKSDGPQGLMRGYFSALSMRFVGLPCYFGGNELTMRWYKKTFPAHSDFVTSLVAGGAAGICFWIACLPLDTLKTAVQGQKPGPNQLSAGQIARNIYAQRGLRGFYAGFSAAIIRAVPANASVFGAVSIASDILKQRGW